MTHALYTTGDASTVHPIVSDRKSDCQGKVGCHGTHGNQNCCHGLNHVENGGFNRERLGVSLVSCMTVTMTVKKLTVKHFCEMGEYNNSILK